jgi:hypothetical protein
MSSLPKELIGGWAPFKPVSNAVADVVVDPDDREVVEVLRSNRSLTNSVVEAPTGGRPVLNVSRSVDASKVELKIDGLEPVSIEWDADDFLSRLRVSRTAERLVEAATGRRAFGIDAPEPLMDLKFAVEDALGADPLVTLSCTPKARAAIEIKPLVKAVREAAQRYVGPSAEPAHVELREGDEWVTIKVHGPSGGPVRPSLSDVVAELGPQVSFYAAEPHSGTFFVRREPEDLG